MTSSTETSIHPIPLIGLAGGIASGKSTVAGAFAELGCIVSDSDAQARAALTRPEVVEQLSAWWGGGILDGEGRVDRRAVARIVFSDPTQLRRLEGLIHPLILQSRDELIEQAVVAGARAVVVDAPLLFEAGLDADCDAVVFVEAPYADRLERVRVFRGWDGGELDRREKSQWALDDKRARADYVVVNDAGSGAIWAQVKRVLMAILRSHPSA